MLYIEMVGMISSMHMCTRSAALKASHGSSRRMINLQGLLSLAQLCIGAAPKCKFSWVHAVQGEYTSMQPSLHPATWHHAVF